MWVIIKNRLEESPADSKYTIVVDFSTTLMLT